MIQGVFGSEGQLFFEIELITDEEFNFPVEAMLDTGFTGFMAINQQDLESLNWVCIGSSPMRNAQGEKIFEKYIGKVRLDGQDYEILVYAGNQITEILLGSEWLKILPLVVNYQAGVLTLG